MNQLGQTGVSRETDALVFAMGTTLQPSLWSVGNAISRPSADNSAPMTEARVVTEDYRIK